MAGNLYIAEFSGTAMKNAQTIGSARTPTNAEQILAVTAVSNQSAAFNPRTSVIRVRAGTATTPGVTIAFGTNPTAVLATGAITLSPGQTEYYVVDAATSKLAAVNSTD